MGRRWPLLVLMTLAPLAGAAERTTASPDSVRAPRPAYASLPADPVAAAAALVGPCAVTLRVQDRERRAVPHAGVRGWCEDWQIPWPLKGEAVADAAGQVTASLPRGRWVFVAASPAPAARSTAPPSPPLCLVTPTRMIDRDETIVLRPDAEARLSVSLDGHSLATLEQVWLVDPRQVHRTGFVFALTGLPLPATLQVSREGTLQGVFVGAAERGQRLVGELEPVGPGANRAEFTSRGMGQVAVRRDAPVFDTRDVCVEFRRGFALDEAVWSAHPLWVPVTPDEQLLVQPGLVRLRYRFGTGDGQQVLFAPTSHQVAAGQAVTLRPGSALTVSVFHMHDQPFMPKDVLCCAPVFTDADGHLVESWAQQSGPGKGRSPVAFTVMQGDRQVAAGTLPRGLRTEMAAGEKDVALERLEYTFTFPARAGRTTLRCQGRGQSRFEHGRVAVLAPDFLADPARRLAAELAELAPRYDEVVTVTPRDPQRPWTVRLWPTMRVGAMAGGAQRENIWFPVSVLYGLGDDRCHTGPFVVELPHGYQFYHDNPSRWVLWQPLKAEVRRLMGLPMGAGDRTNWGTPGLLGTHDGQPWPNRANVPGFVLYREYGFAPFREYIRRHDVYQVWLPSLGFTEGEALAAAFSVCTGQDVTPLFRAFGWDADPQRVALARRLLATAPDPVVGPTPGLFTYPCRLTDGNRAGDPAIAYGSAPKARPARFGVTFPRPCRVARLVADFASASGASRSGADHYGLETFDGKAWTSLAGTDTRGTNLLHVDQTIEPREVHGLAVYVQEPGAFVERGKPVFSPACYELEVFDDRGRSLTRPAVPAAAHPRPAAPAAGTAEDDADPDGRDAEAP